MKKVFKTLFTIPFCSLILECFGQKGFNSFETVCLHNRTSSQAKVTDIRLVSLNQKQSKIKNQKSKVLFRAEKTDIPHFKVIVQMPWYI